MMIEGKKWTGKGEKQDNGKGCTSVTIVASEHHPCQRRPPRQPMESTVGNLCHHVVGHGCYEIVIAVHPEHHQETRHQGQTPPRHHGHLYRGRHKGHVSEV